MVVTTTFSSHEKVCVAVEPRFKISELFSGFSTDHFKLHLELFGIAKFVRSLSPAITSKVSEVCSTPSTTVVVLNKTGIEDSLASRVTSIPPRSHSCLTVT